MEQSDCGMPTIIQLEQDVSTNKQLQLEFTHFAQCLQMKSFFQVGQMEK